MRMVPVVGRFLVISVCLAAGAVAAVADEAHVYLSAYGSPSRFTGDARVSGGTVGTDFDLEDTLGIDPEETVAGLDGFFEFALSRIDFGYSHADYSGSASLSDDLVFNGVTYSSGERVRSDIRFDHYRLMYGLNFGLKVVNVGFLVGGHYVDVDARVTSSATGREQEDLRAPIPAVGVTLGVHPIPQIAIHAQVSGMSVTLSDVSAKLVDGFAGFHYLPIPKLAIVVGYRYFLLDAEDDDDSDEVNIAQRGPYAGIALHL